MLPLCVRIDHDDEDKRRELLADGWREIETLVTWERPGGENCLAQTVEQCIDIARQAFTHDRLHNDPQVSKDEADAAKEAWVIRNLTEQKWVCSAYDPIDKRVDGFLCSKMEGGVIVIDLIAVRPSLQGKGIGAFLLDHVLGWGLPIRAGTQQHNKAGMAFYKKHGFQIVKRQRTFHK